MAFDSCRGLMSRRVLVRLGALTLGGWHWPRLAGAQERERSRSTSVILFWMWGGPSQFETFDPKPDAPAEYRGPFRPIRTTVPGMDICELFPRLATQGRRLALIRSQHPDFGMITSRMRGLRPDGLPQYLAIPSQPFMVRPTYLGLQHQGFAAG